MVRVERDGRHCEEKWWKSGRTKEKSRVESGPSGQERCLAHRFPRQEIGIRIENLNWCQSSYIRQREQGSGCKWLRCPGGNQIGKGGKSPRGNTISMRPKRWGQRFGASAKGLGG